MGYTGAVFERFFGTSVGMIASLGALLTWCLLPVLRIRQKLVKKDF